MSGALPNDDTDWCILPGPSTELRRLSCCVSDADTDLPPLEFCAHEAKPPEPDIVITSASSASGLGPIAPSFELPWRVSPNTGFQCVHQGNRPHHCTKNQTIPLEPGLMRAQ